jgi:hypothetical protein
MGVNQPPYLMTRAATVRIAFTHQPMRPFRAISELEIALSAYSKLMQNADIRANVSARSSDLSHFPHVQAGAMDPLIQEMRSRKQLRERRSHLLLLLRAGRGSVARAGP